MSQPQLRSKSDAIAAKARAADAIARREARVVETVSREIDRAEVQLMCTLLGGAQLVDATSNLVAVDVSQSGALAEFLQAYEAHVRGLGAPGTTLRPIIVERRGGTFLVPREHIPQLLGEVAELARPAEGDEAAVSAAELRAAAAVLRGLKEVATNRVALDARAHPVAAARIRALHEAQRQFEARYAGALGMEHPLIVAEENDVLMLRADYARNVIAPAFVAQADQMDEEEARMAAAAAAAGTPPSPAAVARAVHERQRQVVPPEQMGDM